MNLKRTVFIIAFVPAFLLWHLAFAEMISVKGNNVNMRSGPSTKDAVLWTIEKGFPLQVVKKSGDWIQVRDFEGSLGWVNASVVSNEHFVVVKVQKGTGKNINVRSTPKNGDVVATAVYGVVFKMLSQKNGWVQVEHENGVKGWIRKDLLWGI